MYQQKFSLMDAKLEAGEGDDEAEEEIATKAKSEIGSGQKTR